MSDCTEVYEIIEQKVSRNVRESLKELRISQSQSHKSSCQSKESTITFGRKKRVGGKNEPSHYDNEDLLVSSSLCGVARKKCIEPQTQPQLLTIQSMYDNDDEVTVHPLNLSSWTNQNFGVNTR